MHTRKAILADGLSCMRPTRFELVTFGFGDQRSNPTELRARLGANVVLRKNFQKLFALEASVDGEAK